MVTDTSPKILQDLYLRITNKQCGYQEQHLFLANANVTGTQILGLSAKTLRRNVQICGTSQKSQVEPAGLWYFLSPRSTNVTDLQALRGLFWDIPRFEEKPRKSDAREVTIQLSCLKSKLNTQRNSSWYFEQTFWTFRVISRKKQRKRKLLKRKSMERQIEGRFKKREDR